MKLIECAPGVVLGQLSGILDQIGTIIVKQKKESKSSVTNLLRIALKTIENCRDIPDIENNTHFHDFISKQYQDKVLAPIFQNFQ